MRKNIFLKTRMFVFVLFAGIGFMIFAGAAPAGADSHPLRFSCSAQMHTAFGQTFFDAFTDQTGIEVDLYVCSSDTALERLANDAADLAGLTKGLYHRHQAYGYHEMQFAKDPLVLFTNQKVGVKSLSREQIQGIFSGRYNNWKEVGGKDHPIVTIIPGQHTGAHWNFRSEFMRGMHITYDFMSYKSAAVVRAAKVYPYVISFLTRAAVYNEGDLKVLDVDGISPDSPDYKYFQPFAFVAKGRPEAQAKALIDFTVSGEGKKILEKKGVIYIAD